MKFQALVDISPRDLAKLRRLLKDSDLEYGTDVEDMSDEELLEAAMGWIQPEPRGDLVQLRLEVKRLGRPRLTNLKQIRLERVKDALRYSEKGRRAQRLQHIENSLDHWGVL